jgi:anti-sigma B factor antagonist
MIAFSIYFGGGLFFARSNKNGGNVMKSFFPLSISVSGEAVSRIELKGELDIYTSPKLSAVLSDLLEQGCIHIILDLSRLQFIDSAGLVTLVRHNENAVRAGGSLILLNPGAQLRKVLRLTALDRHLRIEFNGVLNKETAPQMKGAGYA